MIVIKFDDLDYSSTPYNVSNIKWYNSLHPIFLKSKWSMEILNESVCMLHKTSKLTVKIQQPPHNKCLFVIEKWIIISRWWTWSITFQRQAILWISLTWVQTYRIIEHSADYIMLILWSIFWMDWYMIHRNSTPWNFALLFDHFDAKQLKSFMLWKVHKVQGLFWISFIETIHVTITFTWDKSGLGTENAIGITSQSLHLLKQKELWAGTSWRGTDSHLMTSLWAIRSLKERQIVKHFTELITKRHQMRWWIGGKNKLELVRGEAHQIIGALGEIHC